MRISLRVAFLSVAIAFASQAMAETYPDCEKLENPLAYNQCLAAHGPSAAGALAGGRGGDGAPAKPQSRRWFSRSPSGRQRAFFYVGAAASPSKQRRHSLY